MVPKVVMAYSELGHTFERHAADKALDSKKGEAALQEAWQTVSSGFPLYGLSPIIIGFIVFILIAAMVAYSVAGKGRGSHAGREEVRRSYRRQLAREMAKQDAAEIKAGKKPRRRWMQW